MKHKSKLLLSALLATASLNAAANSVDQYMIYMKIKGMKTASTSQQTPSTDLNQTEFTCNIIHSGRTSTNGLCSYGIWTGEVSGRTGTGTCEQNVATVDASGRTDTGTCIESM